MRSILCAVVLLCFWAIHASATTYYLSPSGNDSRPGTSASAPWRTPNHALNCGDTIIAATSSSYSYRNFGPGNWGTVSCSSGNNVAWLKCATFDGCKITTPAGVQTAGISIDQSYWGVQGWEVSVQGNVYNGLSCFNAQPSNNNGNIHHVLFANNVANGCDLAGFGAGPVDSGNASVDYIAIVGNISYGAGASNLGCGSGIGIFKPAAVDDAGGTHIYVAGNFVYGTSNPPGCWDGNGIIFDSFDGRGNTPAPYHEQAVIDNNISIGNAAVGVRVEYNNNSAHGSAHSAIHIRHNTLWGNSWDWYQFGSPDCGEVLIQNTVNTYAYNNLAATNQSGCYGFTWFPMPAYDVKDVDNSSQIYANWGYAVSGTNTLASGSQGGFSFDPTNVLGTDPQYAHPNSPGSPSCGGAANVPACMASVVANFTPSAPGASTYGYQPPSASPIYDSLFPQWLCNTNLPGGLVTMGCAAGSLPTVTAQPTSQTVCQNNALSLSVGAINATSYQWSVGGVAIAGATSATYSLTSAQLTNTGAYSVQVSNGAGSVTSTATVNVLGANIYADPASLSVLAGQPATFAVTASGNGALAFQWYVINPGSASGTPIAGATGSSYTTSATASGNGARFYVIITDACGSAHVSGQATLTVAGGSVAGNSGSGSSGSGSSGSGNSSGSTYFLSPTGNDNNSGTSLSAPWLTPNHALNCGDTIVAATSTAYSYRNFGPGNWGTVSCSSGNNVAWLKCASFDGCKMTTPTGVQTAGIWVDQSYWGVQGWEVSVQGNVANGLSCFNAGPSKNTGNIHHVLFANNVANGCDLAGFGAGPVYGGNSSIDYLAVIGNISYGAGASNTGCGSGIDIFQPAAVDDGGGTHIYVGGNFVYGTTNPPGCWDGNGIIFDSFDGRGNTPAPYREQAVIDNNIAIGNAAAGVRVEYNNNSAHGSAHSSVHLRHNTMWGNSRDWYQFGSADCGELLIQDTANTLAYGNLAATNQVGCYGNTSNPMATYAVKDVDNSSDIYANWGYAVGGSNTLTSGSQGGFSFGSNNVLGIDPQYAHPTVPGAPSCSGAANVPACMAPLLANFTPQTSGASVYGYQTPVSSPINDNLFPQWVCNTNLPNGLVTMGCLAN